MSRNLCILIVLLLSVTIVNAQPPSGYYSSAANKECAALKTALYSIISNSHNPQTYNAIWNQYSLSDTIKKPGANNYVIWDMYSFKANGTANYYFTPITDQCGNYSAEGNCYNREHSFPKSWFNDEAPAISDYIHIFPTDGWVNGKRSNYRFGEVATATYTSSNGTKLGSSATAGISGTVFEPIDEYKGDFARVYLYMVTRYQNRIATWAGYNTDGASTLSNNTFPSVNINYLKLMLKWHNQDPVSEKEKARNNGAYNFQNNRNPYVDSPQYVTKVWNSNCAGLAALPINIVYFSGKLIDGKIHLTWETENEINFNRFEVERSFNGRDFYQIGYIKASEAKQYNFTDNANTIRGKRVYYRLKQIDNDGTYTYSEVFSVHIPLNIKYNIFPNPATNFIVIEAGSNDRNIPLRIQITDLVGRVLIQNKYTNSNNQILIPIQQLPQGTYIVKITANNESFIHKVIKGM
ncbi:MAG: endonuclease [Chitinophagaceae bacterium]|nr:endonuclease [Chitinophagaceae bacterium]MCW5904531.1 endonuclease [Chitinophagaceae bacterium]